MAIPETNPRATRLGFIGTGVMGAAMCRRLLEKGYAMTVHSRTRAKAEPLLSEGARWAPDPRCVALESEVVFSMVGLPEDVRQVAFGTAGVLEALSAGALFIDMTTSEPGLAVQIAERARARGAHSLDAPVSGGDVGARAGTLSIMVGGEEAAFRRALPLFEVLGKTIRLQGPAGAGQHTKLVNQMLIAPMMIGVCEALLFAERAGLDPAEVIESVGSGAAGSWAINQLGPRIIARDFAAGFYVEHFIKDMRMAQKTARDFGLRLPGLDLAERLYTSLAEHGFGKHGTQALFLELERRSAPGAQNDTQQ